MNTTQLLGMQREAPDHAFAYSGLTVIYKPSRFDRKELLSGIAGSYFDSSLMAGGNPKVHRRTIDVRGLSAALSEPLLDGTKVILVMGPEAHSSLCPSTRLDEQRGSPYYYNGIPCISTYAPQDAFDPRNFFTSTDGDDEENGDDKDATEGKTTHGATLRKNWRFWMRQDIKKAVRYVTAPPTQKPFNYHEFPKIEEVEHLLLTRKGGHLYFDIETNEHLEMTCFGFAFDEADVWVVPMLQTYLQPQQHFYNGQTHRLMRALAIALRDNTVVIHNSMFDLFVLAYRYGLPLVGKVYDTMLAHNRCFIEVEKSLGHVISLYTDLPYHKNEGIFVPRSYVQYKQLLSYNGKDVFALTQVKPEIDKTAKRLGAEESVQQINRMVLPYLTMTLQGIALNTEKIEAIASYHERWNTQIKRILNILTGIDFNPNSWQQVAKYLYDDLKIKRPSKDVTAEKTLLQLLLKHDVPVIHGILQYRGNQKRVSKVRIKTKKAEPRYYLGPHLHENKEEPRITTSWRLGKTVTMRLGSSKLLRRWGDNLQNWEKMLRKVIRPDKGKCFLQIDQSGAEALIVAYLCRPGQLRDLFLFDINPHCYLAMHLFQRQFEEILKFDLAPYVRCPVRTLPTLPETKNLFKEIKKSDEWPPDRRYYFIGKQGNHSLNYDCKARAFRLNMLGKSEGAVSLDLVEAQRVIDTRMKLFPEIPAWHQDVVNQAKRTNILRNLFGHPRVVTQLIHEGMYKELYAFIPQSTVGQITNYAIIELQERILGGDELLLKAGVDVMQNNHDSVLVQCLPEFKEAVGRELVKHINRKLVSPRGEPFQMKSEVQWSMTSWGEMENLKL